MRLLPLLFCGLLLPFSTPVAAQERDRLHSRGDLLGWEAVGRLDSRMGTCTGTLIARDLVLTAAHCVVNDRTGKPMNPGDLTFHAGYHHGATIATRGVARVAVADGFVASESGPHSAEQIIHDVALLKLDYEVLSDEANPFRIHTDAANGSKVTLVSYGRGRNEALQRESGCALKNQYRGGIMSFDCDVTYGSSGSPVFIRDAGRLRILSVISASSTHPDKDNEAYGMALPEIVSALRAELRREGARPVVSTGAKRIKVGSITDSDGSGPKRIKVTRP